MFPGSRAAVQCTSCLPASGETGTLRGWALKWVCFLQLGNGGERIPCINGGLPHLRNSAQGRWSIDCISPIFFVQLRDSVPNSKPGWYTPKATRPSCEGHLHFQGRRTKPVLSCPWSYSLPKEGLHQVVLPSSECSLCSKCCSCWGPWSAKGGEGSHSKASPRNILESASCPKVNLI